VDQRLAENLSLQLKISLEQIAREEYELLILQKLLETRAGNALVFKGGTALRLAYGSPRLSDDLDFSLLAPLAGADFVQAAEAAATAAPQVRLVEALAKQFTLFALYRIREAYLPYAFSVKVEVSTRPETWDREQDYALRLLTSPVTPISVLAQAATLERMWTDKRAALADRHQPRDLYDVWFIAQRLRLPFAPDLSGFDRPALKRELRKYLPTSQWPIVDQWSRDVER
jgi:predicted nucleotidyltransferase component of viral defense system